MEETPSQAARRRAIPGKGPIHAMGSASSIIMFLVLAVLALGIVVRVGALTDPGRKLIETTLDGVRTGPAGFLEVSGLKGDPFGTFTVERAALRDRDGVWIEGRNLTGHWSPGLLFLRKVDFDSATAEMVTVIRPLRPLPMLDDRDSPVEVVVDNIRSPVRTQPGFSGVEGLYDVVGRFDLVPGRGITSRLDARSRANPRDFASGLVIARRREPVRVDVRAREAQGGAISGALGLDPRLPFSFDLDISDQRGVTRIAIFGVSGGRTFAELRGQLDPTGGSVSGSVRLDASSLTRNLGNSVGPALGVDVTLGRADGAGLQQIDALLSGERATLTLEGPVRRAGGWRSEGARLGLSVGDMGGLVANPVLQGAGLTFNGTLTGGAASFVADGQARATDLAFPGYLLAEASGPLTLRRAEGGAITVSGRVAGAGGDQSGMIGRWLGSAPVLDAVVQRTADGRWLIERGTLTGAAFTATGEGGVDLLGRVRSAGTAAASAAETGIPGARGRLVFDWSVVSAGGGAVTVTARGTGEGFITGNGRIDTIVGNRPRFDVEIGLGGPATLIRRLDLDLAQLDVRGNGRTGPDGPQLAGTLDGDLALIGLERLTGTLGGRFQARPAARGWQVVIDGKTRAFAAGLGALDPLITSTPDVSGTVVLGSRDILLDRVAINGERLDVRISGRVSPDSDMALGLDWTARGPLAFGPLEIAGTTTGTGSITGPVSAPQLLVQAPLERLDFPQIRLAPARFSLVMPLAPGSSGTATVSGQTAYGPLTADARVSLAGPVLRLDDLSVKGAGINADGEVQITGDAASGALRVTAGQGLFLERGTMGGTVTFQGAPGASPRFVVDLTGRGVALRAVPGPVFASLTAAGSGTVERLPLSVRATTSQPVAGSFTGELLVASTSGSTSFTLSGAGQAAGVSLSTASPVRILNGPGGDAITGNVRFTQQGSARPGFLDFDLARNGGQLRGVASVEDFSLSLFSPDLSGMVTGEARLDGRGDRLGGGFTARLTNALSRGQAQDLALNGEVRGELRGDVLSVTGDLGNRQGLDVSVQVGVPVEASAEPMRLALVRNRTLSGQFRAQGEVRPLADLVFAGERIVSGPLTASGTIGGTINQPAFEGSLRLAGGEWLEPRIGLRLMDLELDATLAGDEVVVRTLKARDARQGRIDGSGRIVLGQSNRASTFEAGLERFRLFDTERGEAVASGRIAVERFGDGRASLSGRLSIDQAEFRPLESGTAGVPSMEVEEINLPPSRQVAVEADRPRPVSRGAGPAIGLDVQLVAPRGIFLRGRGLNLEMSLDARVRGTSRAPVLSGQAEVYRGGYTYGGRVFDFEEGGTVTLASSAENIRLNLTAVRRAEDIDARVLIAGTAADPRITLTSTPPLPQDEVLSRVLFGRSTAQLSGFEAVQLAGGLAALAGGDSFDVIGNLRDFVALDRLTFAYGAAGLEVTGGKYLGRDIYLELINEPDVGVISQVEWRPVRDLAITSRLAPDGDARISIRWRRRIDD